MRHLKAPASPAANLELDATLLRSAEASQATQVPESLRFWESREYCVVMGRGCNVSEDVRVEACEQGGVPILRRVSGGGTVLIGPGCLNYSLILSLDKRPTFRSVETSICTILGTVVRALAMPGVEMAGLSDLIWNGRKFSGNAQRRGRRAILHHGTILYSFEIPRVEAYLHEPRRQPKFRSGRTHDQFLCNLPLDAQQICERIASAWVPQGLRLT